MRTLLQRLCFSILLTTAFSGPSFAQDTTKTDLKKAGAETKEAGKATGRAAKHTGKAVATGTKKGISKTAAATEKGADKVKHKVDPK